MSKDIDRNRQEEKVKNNTTQTYKGGESRGQEERTTRERLAKSEKRAEEKGEGPDGKSELPGEVARRAHT